MFVSTVVGVYLVYVLVAVALKIAIRAIKFSICELIAPIPIASYIDPGTSKKAFDNWVNTSVKVYLDLFVRLITVYFIVFVFKELFDNDGIKRMLGQFNEYGWWQGFLVALFIIVGLLNFAKEMPKFITGMLGISDSFSDIGDMFKRAGSFAATSGAMATAGVTNFIGRRASGASVGQSLRSAFAGSGSAFWRGSRAALNGKGMKETFNIAHNGARQARINRMQDEAEGINVFDRISTRARDWAGISDDVSLAKPQIDAASNVSKALSGFTSAVSGRMDKHENLSFRSGESQVLDSIARAIERNGGVYDLAHSNNASARRLADLFEVDANGHIMTFDEHGNQTHDGTGHVRFARGQGITNRELQEYAEGLHGTALGGFFESNGLKQDVIREIRNDVAAHRAVELVRDIQGNVVDTVHSGLNEHRDIELARNAVYQAQRENATNLINVDTNRVGANGERIVINGSQQHQAEFDRNFSDYSDMMQDYQRHVQDTVNTNERNRRAEAARRSQQRHDSNRQNSGK